MCSQNDTPQHDVSPKGTMYHIMRHRVPLWDVVNLTTLLL